jgi:hypothetical protein
MTETMTRKAFCGALLSGTVVLLVQGCGGGGSYSVGPGPMGLPVSGCSDAIAANHGHTLIVARTDLDSLVDKTYNIQGAATHNHTLTLTVAQLGMLRAGIAVTATTSTTELHSHAVTVTCV